MTDVAFCFVFAEVQRELREAADSMGMRSKAAYCGAPLFPATKVPEEEHEGWNVHGRSGLLGDGRHA